jgi:hypothetical protein
VLSKITPSGTRTVIYTFPVGAGPVGVAIVPTLARPVGGLVMSTNNLEILIPYIALAGLVAAVSAVVVVKKRRE